MVVIIGDIMKNDINTIKNKIKEVFGKYTFIENGHYYLCNGKRVGISTTGLIHQYTNDFDSEKISQQVANKRGVSQYEILEEWRIENLHSTIKGNFIHEFAQSLWEGKEHEFDYSNVPKEIDIERLKNDVNKLIPQAINFYNDYKDMYELIGCEVFLGDEDFDECGATDQILYNKYTGGIAIIDYKTNKEIKRESYKHQKMLIPLHKYDDCNYMHYSIQLSGYKYKFEKNTELKVDETFIVYFSTSAKNYEIIEPLNMENDVKKIMNMRRVKNMKSVSVLIIGKSGSGKSSSLRNLDADEYSLVNPLRKELPFKTSVKGLESDNYELIKKFITETPKKIVVIDDSNYLLTNQFMRNHSKGGSGNAVFGVYNELADNYWNLVQHQKNTDGGKIIFNFMHEDETESGNIIPKTVGKLLNDKVCIEGMYTIVLRAMYKDGKHIFRLKTDGNDCVKTPIGMFEEEECDNDLKYIVEKIREYYELDKKEEEN